MAGSKNEYSRSTPKKDKSEHEHDTPSRMDSPIAGNPAQRKNQVQSIANSIFEDGQVERVHPDDPNDLEDGNVPPETAHSPVMATNHMHEHTSHDHATGKSTTHSVPHGTDCPACGSGYMNTGGQHVGK